MIHSSSEDSSSASSLSLNDDSDSRFPNIPKTSTLSDLDDDETNSSSDRSPSPHSMQPCPPDSTLEIIPMARSRRNRKQSRRVKSISFSPIIEDKESTHHSSGLKNRASPKVLPKGIHTQPNLPVLQDHRYILRRPNPRDEDSSSSESDDDKYRQRPRKNKKLSLQYLQINVQVILETMLLAGIICLLWDFHTHREFVNAQLERLHQEKKSILLQVNEIARSSLRNHEKFTAVAGKKNEKQSDDVGYTDDFIKTSVIKRYRELKNDMDVAESQLIRKRMTDFLDQEEELNEELKFMQSKIQQSAKRRIRNTFGTGPIEVVLEMNLGDFKYKKGTPLSILLFVDEVPHAVWTWLEQIQVKYWDGSTISWKRDHQLDILPAITPAVVSKKQLDFPEKSRFSQKVWTMCAKNKVENEGIDLYFNIQKNRIQDDMESCLGVVVDGKAAIRELLFEAEQAGKVEIRRVFVKQRVIL